MSALQRAIRKYYGKSGGSAGPVIRFEAPVRLIGSAISLANGQRLTVPPDRIFEIPGWTGHPATAGDWRGSQKLVDRAMLLSLGFRELDISEPERFSIGALSSNWAEPNRQRQAQKAAVERGAIDSISRALARPHVGDEGLVQFLTARAGR
jgi:hypothetical protein